MPAIGTGDGRERRAEEGEAPHHDRRHVEVGERAAVGLGQRPAACRVPARRLQPRLLVRHHAVEQLAHRVERGRVEEERRVQHARKVRLDAPEALEQPERVLVEQARERDRPQRRRPARVEEREEHGDSAQLHRLRQLGDLQHVQRAPDVHEHPTHGKQPGAGQRGLAFRLTVLHESSTCNRGDDRVPRVGEVRVVVRQSRAPA
eukprot:Transcript_1692.p2 GENE.Transcript_1692~~Transcript_1692.p2  ORF type:complete len:204 (+),score=18.02 Transcript_1692:990-1601(+)